MLPKRELYRSLQVVALSYPPRVEVRHEQFSPAGLLVLSRTSGGNFQGPRLMLRKVKIHDAA